MPLSLLSWKQLQKNSLRGFASVRYGSLKISDISVHNANGKRWANLPAKPMIGQDGKPQRDDRGKIKYVPLLEWESREASDKFSEEVIAAVEREYPRSTDV
jgi:hypothetical protein